MDVRAGCHWPVVFPSCPVFDCHSVWMTPASRHELGRGPASSVFWRGWCWRWGRSIIVYPYHLEFFRDKYLPLLPLFIYPIIYSYQHRLANVSFILWAITKYPIVKFSLPESCQPSPLVDLLCCLLCPFDMPHPFLFLYIKKKKNGTTLLTGTTRCCRSICIFPRASF